MARPSLRPVLPCVLLAVVAGACVPCEHELTPGSTVVTKVDALFADYEPASCTPDQAIWDSAVRDLVAQECGSCHGETPSFGAPLPLLDYDMLLSGEPGNRPVDRIARRSAARTMPPPTNSPLAHDQLDLLVEWATCGEVHPDHSVGLKVDRERYAASVPANADLPSFDLVAEGFELGPTTLDAYRCFAMDVPVDEPRFLRRMQVVLDESRVLHHVVVTHDPERVSADESSFDCEDWPPENNPFLWAWAPGGSAFDFAEGGLRISPGERLVVQIHYNNGAGLEDVSDHSGVRFFHGPAEGKEWFMWNPGPEGFYVPEGESASCGRERMDTDMDILAGMPHMHELGAEFHQWIERKDGTTEQLVNLTGWDFEAQLFYEFDTHVGRGDVLHTWCGYRNESGEPAYYGTRTQDEMCYDFMYVSAPP